MNHEAKTERWRNSYPEKNLNMDLKIALCSRNSYMDDPVEALLIKTATKIKIYETNNTINKTRSPIDVPDLLLFEHRSLKTRASKKRN